jgi:hypothetical protein
VFGAIGRQAPARVTQPSPPYQTPNTIPNRPEAGSAPFGRPARPPSASASHARAVVQAAIEPPTSARTRPAPAPTRCGSVARSAGGRRRRQCRQGRAACRCRAPAAGFARPVSVRRRCARRGARPPCCRRRARRADGGRPRSRPDPLPHHARGERDDREPDRVSAAPSSHAASCDLSAISGTPRPSITEACPSRHHAPRRAARRGSAGRRCRRRRADRRSRHPRPVLPPSAAGASGPLTVPSPGLTWGLARRWSNGLESSSTG